MPDVVMPRLSDTMEEGVLSRWLKAEGDEVHRGDVLAEVETDKATMDLESYDEGVLQRLLVPEGAVVPIGVPLAVIGTGPAPALTPAATPEPHAGTAQPGAALETTPTGARVLTSPLARRIARERGLDLATVAGTGPGGRILRVDVDAAIAAADAATEPARPDPAAAPVPAGPAAPVPAGPAAPAPVASPATAVPSPAANAGADDEEIPLTAVRRVTAQRLAGSASTPHFYLTSVVDAGRLLAFRAEVNDRLATTGTKVSVTDLLVRACAVTLRAHPQVNSSWGGDKILRHRRIHVGIAVAVEDGLVVPVVRDPDRKSLGEIAAEAHALADRARAGRLAPDEFRGGTFTISNLGMYGIDQFTAVINPPEAAILAVGAATEEPVVRDGQLAVRTAIKLTVSVDHRVLDGATAAEFLRDLKDTLEEPLRIVI